MTVWNQRYSSEEHLFGTGGPSDPDMLYTAELLRTDLPQLQPSFLQELDRFIQEGCAHNGISSVVHGVFPKNQT